MTRHLHAVPDVPEQPVEQRADLYAYEHEQRKRIISRDWSSVHIKGDRREPVYLEWGGRGWRK